MFVKRSRDVPAGYFAWEAAGLRWLADIGGAPVVPVIEVTPTSLTLELLQSVAPSQAAAVTFGERLARTHDAGAPAFGSGPEGYEGAGFFGPLEHPLPMSITGQSSYGEFYADRLEEMRGHCGSLADPLASRLSAICDRLRGGDFDDTAGSPARLHGDLWSGNLMWTDSGAVLIDPAAHGGHRESDLAMLHLFGCPHLDAIVVGYLHESALPDRWQDRIPLHQLYPLLAHVALFGGGYAAKTAGALDQALAL